jgi:hypothetical protein
VAFGSKFTPYKGIQLDLAENLMPADMARYIKNLVYSFDDTSDASGNKGGQVGNWKPLQSNALYIEDFELPAGTNFTVGGYSFKATKQVFVFVFNDNKEHTVYRLNGNDKTFNIVYQRSTLNFQLNPENFIHQGACWLEVVYISDPVTGEQIPRSFLMFTDGVNPQRFISVEDSISTNGFDPVLFPYFQGDYDPMILINMGVPTPKDCIGITEIPNTLTSEQQNNNLIFNTWQFRLRWYDVWGRMSEYGIISDMFIPGNDCISASSGLSRCLNLLFKSPPPHINQIEVAYRNCNSNQWYKSDTLDLYVGSPLGQWWLRPKNPNINFNSVDHTITYQFCADKECQAITPADTDRLENPLPRTSEAITKIDKFISLSNNKDKFLPFTQTLKDNITFSVIPPSGQSNEFTNITVWIEIFNPFLNRNQPIYQQNISAGQPKAYGFGAFDTEWQYRSFFAYFQYFKNLNQKGFVGYLAGTDTFAISRQFRLSSSGVLTEVTDFSISPIGTFGDNPDFDKFLHKFEFTNVPKGEYIFRLASHQSDPTTESNYQKTSTYTAGTYAFNFANPTNPVNHSLQVNSAKELVIDACNGSYDTLKDNKILVVHDLTFDHVLICQGTVFNTDDTTQDQRGIPLLRYNSVSGISFTDHNGFYWAARSSAFFKLIVEIYGYCSCNLVLLARNTSGITSQRWQQDFFLNKQINQCANYAAVCNFILIKGKVALCGSQAGIPNTSVVLSRGGQGITDSDGNFTIIATDDVINTTRQDKLYIIPNKCPFTDCNDACVQPIQITIQKCTTCTDRIITVNDTLLKFIDARGLLSGGVYPVGVVGWDWLGRGTFIQDLGLIRIPSVQQTKLFSPSRVKVDILPGVIFPIEFTYLTFFIGEETTIEDYITWIVDNVEFIDNTGLINTTTPTQIKIFYSSLVEYNKQNNFNTTVNWNFLEPLPSTAATGTAQTPFTHDKVEFLINGDGTFFDKSIISLVKYDQTGQFFLIDYTPDLKNLKANAFIRIIRPKVCLNIEPEFEVCFVVDLMNGKPQQTSFFLNVFDTYYLFRQIPVPTLQEPVADPPVFINEPRIFGVPFEHNSPSDFWGQGCKNIGRINVRNPQETVIYSKDQIALSGVFASAQLNFLNFFDDANKTTLRDVNGIVSVITKPGIVLVIGQADNYIVGFNDNLARVNSDGTVQVSSAADKFGQPQRKTEADYGCLLFDKNTIYEKNGLVQWLDTSMSCLVQHNFQYAISVSETDLQKGIPGGVDGWLRAKIKQIQAYNLINTNKRYWHGVVNPASNGYLLTDFIIGSTNYLNELREPDITVPETMEFSIVSKYWKASYSATPEYYSELEGELTAQQLFLFIAGKPYSQYNDIQVASYGMVFGTSVNRIFEIVVVMDGLRKKKPLAIGMICKESQYFCDRAITETGAITRMLLSQWIQASFGWYAPFLCSLSTPVDPNRETQTTDNVLMDGDPLVGNYIKVRLIGDPSADNIYSELQGALVSVMPDGNNLQNQ